MAYNTFGHIKRIPVLFTTVLLLCQFFLNLFDVYLYLMWLFRSENNFFSCCSLLKFEMVGLRWQKTNQLHVKLKHVWHNRRKKHYNIHFLWLHLKTLEYFFFNVTCIRILPYVHEIQEQQNYILVLNTTSARWM